MSHESKRKESGEKAVRETEKRVWEREQGANDHWRCEITVRNTLIWKYGILSNSQSNLSNSPTRTGSGTGGVTEQGERLVSGYPLRGGNQWGHAVWCTQSSPHVARWAHKWARVLFFSDFLNFVGFFLDFCDFFYIFCFSRLKHTVWKSTVVLPESDKHSYSLARSTFVLHIAMLFEKVKNTVVLHRAAQLYFSGSTVVPKSKKAQLCFQ